MEEASAVATKRVIAYQVGQLMKDKNAEVISFIRFEVGEGIEKKEDNFVEEVMAQVREQ